MYWYRCGWLRFEKWSISGFAVDGAANSAELTSPFPPAETPAASPAAAVNKSRRLNPGSCECAILTVSSYHQCWPIAGFWLTHSVDRRAFGEAQNIHTVTEAGA